MRPINLICSSFKLRSSVLILTVAISACQRESVRNSEAPYEATGKGNGGNTLSLTKEQVQDLHRELKPKLEILFEGLSYLVQAENSAPGATDLSLDKNLVATLETMFPPKEDGKSVIEDLATEDNLKLQEEPCIDFRGVENAAAAVAGEVGGQICFSITKIRQASIKNLENAAEIFFLALATHEFVHHYVNSGDAEKDEIEARAVQDFVEQQLARSLADEESEIISTDGNQYLQRFRDKAKSILESAGGLVEP